MTTIEIYNNHGDLICTETAMLTEIAAQIRGTRLMRRYRAGSTVAYLIDENGREIASKSWGQCWGFAS